MNISAVLFATASFCIQALEATYLYRPDALLYLSLLKYYICTFNYFVVSVSILFIFTALALMDIQEGRASDYKKLLSHI